MLYRVVTATGRELGSLDQDFVDRLVEEMTSFLLGGRAWVVEHVDHHDRRVRVREAPRGKKPSWGGYIPQMLSFELCQRVRHVLAATAPYPYADPAAAAAIEARRADLGDLLRRDGRALQLDGGTARWWTFAGGRINHTLKYGLEWLRGWKAVADNFQLRIKGPGVTHGTVERAITALSREDFWRAPGTLQALLTRLPPYRLSKFQPCLPDEFSAEMVGRYLLDVEGAVSHAGIASPR